MINKGMHIRARWLVAHPASLAGAQPKVAARECEAEGIVRHVRGDRPTDPKRVRIFIDAPGGTETPPGCTCGPHVGVDPAHVVEVL